MDPTTYTSGSCPPLAPVFGSRPGGSQWLHFRHTPCNIPLPPDLNETHKGNTQGPLGPFKTWRLQPPVFIVLQCFASIKLGRCPRLYVLRLDPFFFPPTPKPIKSPTTSCVFSTSRQIGSRALLNLQVSIAFYLHRPLVYFLSPGSFQVLSLSAPLSRFSFTTPYFLSLAHEFSFPLPGTLNG